MISSVLGFDIVIHGVDVLFVIGVVALIPLGIWFIVEHVVGPVVGIVVLIKEWWEDRHD